MILNNDDPDRACARDEAKGAISNINNRHMERNVGPYNILVTSELGLESVKPITIFGPWYNIEDGYYINDSAPRLGSCD
jgi:hypothetical protein